MVLTVWNWKKFCSCSASAYADFVMNIPEKVKGSVSKLVFQ